MQANEDSHFCLRCKTQIAGLENYIAHRQQNCLAPESSVHQNVNNNHPCPETQHEIVYSSCNNDTDFQNASDFFSSLELKCNASDSYGSSAKKLSTDLFPMTFEYDSDTYAETENGYYPPQSHTGGKWEPGTRPDLTNEQWVLRSPSPSQKSFECLVCKKNYQDKAMLEKHVNLFHKNSSQSVLEKITNLESNTEVIGETEKSKFACGSCEKTLSNEKDFLLHLLSYKHKEKYLDEDLWNKELISLQSETLRLFPFQCYICQFFCLEKSDFMKHMEDDEHQIKVTQIRRNLFCQTCKFETLENFEMIDHLTSINHTPSLLDPEKFHPVMIVEKTFRINCKFCNGKCRVSKEEKYSATKTTYTCPYCEFTTKSSSYLKCHICKEHQRSNRIVSKTQQKAKMKKTNLKLTKPTCSTCNESFITLSQLKLHFFSKHTEQCLNCSLCNRLFVSATDYEQHCQSRMHIIRLLQDKKPKENEELYAYKCHICNFVTQSKGHMSLHSVQHDGPITETRYDESGIKLIGKIYQCPFCSKEFRLSQLESHVYTHTGEKPFPCVYCNKGFSQKSSRKTHENLHKGTAKTWNCTICPFKTAKKLVLEQHKLTHNTKNKFYVCDTCGRSFNTVLSLILHTKRHMGKQKYSCTQEGCEMEYWTAEELHKHSDIHLVEELRKPSDIHLEELLCEICGTSSKSKTLLMKHQRSHTGEKPYKCNECNYTSSNCSNIIRHKHIHTGIKLYKCPYCPYTCNNHDTIKKHIQKTKKHQGLKIYPCPFCLYSYNELKDIRSHILECHSQQVPMNAKDNPTSCIYKNDKSYNLHMQKVLPFVNIKPKPDPSKNKVLVIQRLGMLATIIDKKPKAIPASQANMVILQKPASTLVQKSLIKTSVVQRQKVGTARCNLNLPSSSKLVPLRPKKSNAFLGNTIFTPSLLQTNQLFFTVNGQSIIQNAKPLIQPSPTILTFNAPLINKPKFTELVDLTHNDTYMEPVFIANKFAPIPFPKTQNLNPGNILIQHANKTGVLENFQEPVIKTEAMQNTNAASLPKTNCTLESAMKEAFGPDIAQMEGLLTLEDLGVKPVEVDEAQPVQYITQENISYPFQEKAEEDGTIYFFMDPPK